MRSKFFALVALAALLLPFSAVSANADVTAKRKHKLQTSQLVALLPASDGIVTLHARRMIDEALPTVFAGNKNMLADVLGKIETLRNRTGIDPRSFEYIAAGINTKLVKPGEYDFEPVIIGRGNIDTNQLIVAAKAASNGKFREERIGEKVIYIFPAKEIAASHTANAGSAKLADKLLSGVMKELAVSAIGPNTIAFGKVERVRETINGTTRVGGDLVELLNKKELAVMNVAARVPNGLGAFLPLDDDGLGRSLDSIRYIFGSMDTADGTAVLNMTARTSKPADAATLFETLDGLKSFGGMLLGGSKRPDQQLYGRLLTNAKLTKVSSDVNLDLTIPQSDLDAIVAILNK